ncbi:MAG: DNA-binding NtrC family response regulator [Candidatus Latescibacterota bacterium]|jgi:DNA-binding NtrC family response regulator
MAESAHILIVDDDEKMQALLQKVLVREGYETTLANNGEEALNSINEHNFDIVISDIRMPNMDGLTLLREIQEKESEITVIMMTAFGSVDSAVEAMKQGAYDYISKPFKMDEVLIVLSRVVEEKRLRRELVSMREELAGRYAFANIVGKSNVMQQVFDLIIRVATTTATILIRGRSGTGKELVARAIHFNSPRKDRPFVPVNCSAIPGDLLESELFGHVKGAFTGAIANKAGLFVEADGGTILLDEIGEMTPELQSKLLRVLQEKEVRPVGGTQNLHVDVRIVAATNQNLEEQVENGGFREDLYYRLNVIPIELPSLRDRIEDIPLLVGHFLEKYAGEASGKKIMSREALAVLMRHSWPGNVRELENVVERAAVLSLGEEIRPDDLPPEMATASGGLLARNSQREASLEGLEKDYIRLVLDQVNGNQTRAAEILGIDRRTLYRKLQSYGEEK